MFNFRKKGIGKKDDNEKDKKEKLNDSIVELKLDQKIESILFFKGEEVSLKYLSKILNLKKKEIRDGVEKLRERLKNSGLVLVENQDKYLLATKPEADKIISQIKEKQDVAELSAAALETLAIILYNGEISKDELNQIRGINSSYILRNLLVRGLIDKKEKEATIFYFPTTDLFLYLGIEKINDLPGFEKVKEKIKNIKDEFIKIENENNKEGEQRGENRDGKEKGGFRKD